VSVALPVPLPERDPVTLPQGDAAGELEIDALMDAVRDAEALSGAVALGDDVALADGSDVGVKDRGRVREGLPEALPVGERDAEREGEAVGLPGALLVGKRDALEDGLTVAAPVADAVGGAVADADSDAGGADAEAGAELVPLDDPVALPLVVMAAEEVTVADAELARLPLPLPLTPIGGDAVAEPDALGGTVGRYGDAVGVWRAPPPPMPSGPSAHVMTIDTLATPDSATGAPANGSRRHAPVTGVVAPQHAPGHRLALAPTRTAARVPQRTA